ncbi:hydrogenase subunit MbhD domain-containing protein [Helicovermis profundi]|uniref:MrpA C-terminal/MbhD domain-containing protein n=1 Tax=Helicovermis profundi TaxID=3065157 RepID=A0AAU9E6R0_9FIRM|nr:hypothetical protein HLPR_06730 [Clostridia bacterium S502]
MMIFNIIILVVMILGAIMASYTKNILASVIIFMVYSFMMAILWQQMNAPDLAITEAAVGAGITSILFIITLRKIKVMKK